MFLNEKSNRIGESRGCCDCNSLFYSFIPNPPNEQTGSSKYCSCGIISVCRLFAAFARRLLDVCRTESEREPCISFCVTVTEFQDAVDFFVKL